MAKFKVGDKVRLKEGLEVGKWYGGIPFNKLRRANAADNDGTHVITGLCEYGPNGYYLDTLDPYVYTEEMLELVEEKKTQKKTKDLKDFFEALVLMSQLENIMKRLDELMKSNEGE